MFGHKWGESPIIFTSDAVKSYLQIITKITKNALSRASHVLFYSYLLLVMLKPSEMDTNFHLSIAATFLFTAGQSIALVRFM